MDDETIVRYYFDRNERALSDENKTETISEKTDFGGHNGR